MSTAAFAAMTASREPAPADAGINGSALTTYVDLAVALVPAEVLSLHALAVSLTTAEDASGSVKIADTGTLTWVFLALTFLSAAIYVVTFRAVKPAAETAAALAARTAGDQPRVRQPIPRFFLWRALIPPAAFVCWTALQPMSAFDAVFPGIATAPRVMAAAIFVVVLAYIAERGAVRARDNTGS